MESEPERGNPMQGLTLRFLALFIGFCLDAALGDPRWIPHPVRGIGRLIVFLEKHLRSCFPKAGTGELLAGIFMLILASGIPTGLTIALRAVCGYVSNWLEFAVDIIFSYQLLAARDLRDESMRVYSSLKRHDLIAARHEVSMIVGRDTDKLDEAEVTRAAVETVAENTSDGVIAPFIYTVLGGVPLGIFYKACNTMDSMIGYKNEKYMYFGRAAALWDDILNFIPARISGVIMCLSASIIGFRGRGAFKVFFRDRLKHKSPNAGHTEAACAGALGIELAGNSSYFGGIVEKPVIGDSVRDIDIRDIPRSNLLMYVSALVALGVFCVVPAVICGLCQSL